MKKNNYFFINFICADNLSLFQISSASMKDIYSPFEFFIPKFLDNPAPIFFLFLKILTFLLFFVNFIKFSYSLKSKSSYRLLIVHNFHMFD